MSVDEVREVLDFLAYNFRSTWDARATKLFKSLDPGAWARVRRNPVRLLNEGGDDLLKRVADDRGLRADIDEAAQGLRRYLDSPGSYDPDARALKLAAYFSPEFGVAEFLPTYSGGLGILAGDHLKAASDLGLPLVGVGLLYREGYFRQALDGSGWQKESYPRVDPSDQPLVPLTNADGSPLLVEVEMAGRPCAARIWKATVGRVDLLLFDCDVESNHPDERSVTDRLYGGDREHRLRQEIVLGIGGVRALRAVGLDPNVWHSNEGHAGFLGLERIRELVHQGVDFDEAAESVRPSTVFTTHTPLAVAIDEFDRDLMERYFTGFAAACAVPFDKLLSIGRPPKSERRDPGSPSFNMAVMGIRLAARVNGVSELHGDVSRDLFKTVWPDRKVEDVPIGHVTNGVHVATWLGPGIRELGDGVASPGWVEDAEASWSWVNETSDAQLWSARREGRARLVAFVRHLLRSQLEGRGESGGSLDWIDGVMDPDVLTIGFARRFAQYKRGTLMLSDPDRLRRLLLDDERPLQIVIAGKAHPLDDGGKEMIRTLFEFSLNEDVRDRMVFLEDYDIELGQILTQGVDVWLNNPRRPLEACGTSGMKAAMNGVINCSVLDGWWDEFFDERVGWTIGGRDVSDDLDRQDQTDAESMYQVLENEIVPLFYKRSTGELPTGWIEKMRTCIGELGGRVSAHRMLNDYLEALYEPAAADSQRINTRSGDA